MNVSQVETPFLVAMLVQFSNFQSSLELMVTSTPIVSHSGHIDIFLGIETLGMTSTMLTGTRIKDKHIGIFQKREIVVLDIAADFLGVWRVNVKQSGLKNLSLSSLTNSGLGNLSGSITT